MSFPKRNCVTVSNLKKKLLVKKFSGISFSNDSKSAHHTDEDLSFLAFKESQLKLRFTSSYQAFNILYHNSLEAPKILQFHFKSSALLKRSNLLIPRPPFSTGRHKSFHFTQ